MSVEALTGSDVDVVIQYAVMLVQGNSFAVSPFDALGIGPLQDSLSGNGAIDQDVLAKYNPIMRGMALLEVENFMLRPYPSSIDKKEEEP